ncbi:Sugar phosphate transporter [Gracilaria domingensis]|nr:Sugar phosphate transporter [Gracilaria domingensis]
MAGGALRIFLSAAIFVLTGVVMTISLQGVLYSGGGDRATFLLAIPNYLGITAVYFFGASCFRLLDSLGVWFGGGNDANRVHLSLYDKKLQPQMGFFETLFHRDRRKLFVLAFNETGGFLTGLTGLSIAGSGLYQVVFSGGTVFTAILTTFFLKKRLSLSQWFFVAVITAGLMITAEQVTHSATETGAASLISGLSFVLVSCLFYSTNYVIAEHVLDDLAKDHDQESDALPPPSGLDLSLYTGGSCLLLFGAYVMAHTVPNWRQLVVRSIERHHGNTTIIMEEYIYLTVASFFHAVTHYDVVATVGAVPIGVLNAIRAVSVFGVSSLFFCSHQASQCYNSRKGISTAIVIIGAIGYSAASAAATAAKGYGRLSQVDAVAARTARKLRRAMSQSVDLSKSLSLSLMQGLEIPSDRSFTLGSATSSSRKRKDSIQATDG